MDKHNFDEYIERRGTDSKKYSPEYYPQDVIPMWIADSDFRAPEPVVAALAERARNGVYGYTPVSSRLREAVCGWEQKRFGYAVAPESVEYVPGVIAGLICTIRALTLPGDGVVILTPSYPPFAAGIESNGRRALRIPLRLTEGRYEIDFARFEAACREPRTRAFILCNPHNPTGRVFTEQELKRLGDICIEHHVCIISDEIHCDLVYAGHKHLPYGSLGEKYAEHCISFINPSKTFNVPGLRTAAMICTNGDIKGRIHDVILSNKAISENIFGTLALCTAYEQCDAYADGIVEYLCGNLSLVREALRSVQNVTLIEPDGTYLLWLDCRALRLSQKELMARFVEKAKVGVQSGTDFGPEGEGFVRMNIACPVCTLREALNRIRQAF